MRIGIGQLWQETNTLNPCATTIDDFTSFGFHRGTELVEAMGSVNELGGFVQSMRQWPSDVEIVGLARAAAWPSGVISGQAFDWFSRELREAIDVARPLDGVLLALHGAMVAEGQPDVEGDILAMVREQIGPDVPLVATLDLHTNLTPAMFQQADCLVLYHCMPHVDIQSTGARGDQ